MPSLSDLVTQQPKSEKSKPTKTADFTVQCQDCYSTNNVITYEEWGEFHIHCNKCGGDFEEKIKIAER